MRVLVAEAESENPVRLDDAGNDVLAEIMIAIRARGVLAEQLVHEPSREHIDAHRRQAMLRRVRHRRRVARLFLEADNAVLVIDSA